MFVVYFLLNGNRQINCGLCILLHVLGIIYLMYGMLMYNYRMQSVINVSLYG